MKRIDMVKLLISNSKVELDEPIASYLLRLIENAGMLPPHVELSDCSELCKPEELFEFANLDGNFVWEKDNEKK